VGAGEWGMAPDSLTDSLPEDLLVDAMPSPAVAYPCGWVAVELDQFFSDPDLLSDATLAEGIVGFERLAAWALARQARLVAALVERRREPGEITDWASDELG